MSINFKLKMVVNDYDFNHFILFYKVDMWKSALNGHYFGMNLKKMVYFW